MANDHYRSAISKPEFLLPTNRVCIEAGASFGALQLSGLVTSYEVGSRSRVEKKEMDDFDLAPPGQRYGYAINSGYIFLDVDQDDPPITVDCLSLFTNRACKPNHSYCRPWREAATHGLVIERLAPDVYRRLGISVVKGKTRPGKQKLSRKILLV